MISVAHASLDSFIGNVDRLIINPLIYLLFALALAYFFWGILQFFTNQENEEKRTASKQHMLWGIIGLTIMMGVFTIMNIIMDTFNVDDVNVKTGDVKLDPYDPPYPPRR